MTDYSNQIAVMLDELTVTDNAVRQAHSAYQQAKREHTAAREALGWRALKLYGIEAGDLIRVSHRYKNPDTGVVERVLFDATHMFDQGAALDVFLRKLKKNGQPSRLGVFVTLYLPTAFDNEQVVILKKREAQA